MGSMMPREASDHCLLAAGLPTPATPREAATLCAVSMKNPKINWGKSQEIRPETYKGNNENKGTETKDARLSHTEPFPRGHCEGAVSWGGTQNMWSC